MKRKQGKSLPWRRFGYVILIIIKFGELLLWFSPRIINALRSYIKHSKECFIRYPNTSKLVKKNSAAPRFFNPLLSVWISDETLFLVFDILLESHSITSRRWIALPEISFLFHKLSSYHIYKIISRNRFLLPEPASPLFRIKEMHS